MELTCINCPMGCTLDVTVDDGKVTKVEGNTCPRGETYAVTEVTAPVRTVTTTALATDGKPVSVKTAEPIPKGMIFDVMKAIKSEEVKLPAKVGDVIIKNVCGTGVDVVSTKTTCGR